MRPLDVLLLYNEPTLSPEHPDYASEAGVLESVAAVEESLASLGHSARRLSIRNLAEFLSEFPGLKLPDAVFNLFEGFDGVGRGEAVIAGLCELRGLPLTGSPAQCLDLVRDKAKTKWLLRGAGLPTADFLRIEPGDSLTRERAAPLLAAGPVIVKPAHEDASLGIGPKSVVTEFAALADRVAAVQKSYGAALIEQFIVGREFNAAILAQPQPKPLPLAEIEFDLRRPPLARLVTYEAKWASGSADDVATAPRCPAAVPDDLAARLQSAALAAFQAVGCCDYARVDMRLDEQGRIFILEINGNPDIGPTAGFARALRVANIEYRQFVAQLLSNACQRRTDISNRRSPS